MELSIMDVTSKQLETYGDVWKQLLKHKIEIIYKISIDKKQNFKDLLTEFIPEAFDNKELWEDEYIINECEKFDFGDDVYETKNYVSSTDTIYNGSSNNDTRIAEETKVCLLQSSNHLIRIHPI